MNNYINEIILSGKILSLVINEKYIVLSIENQIFKNTNEKILKPIK